MRPAFSPTRQFSGRLAANRESCRKAQKADWDLVSWLPDRTRERLARSRGARRRRQRRQLARHNVVAYVSVATVESPLRGLVGLRQHKHTPEDRPYSSIR